MVNPNRFFWAIPITFGAVKGDLRSNKPQRVEYSKQLDPKFTHNVPKHVSNPSLGPQNVPKPSPRTPSTLSTAPNNSPISLPLDSNTGFRASIISITPNQSGGGEDDLSVKSDVCLRLSSTLEAIEGSLTHENPFFAPETGSVELRSPSGSPNSLSVKGSVEITQSESGGMGGECLSFTILGPEMTQNEAPRLTLGGPECGIVSEQPSFGFKIDTKYTPKDDDLEYLGDIEDEVCDAGEWFYATFLSSTPSLPTHFDSKWVRLGDNFESGWTSVGEEDEGVKRSRTSFDLKLTVEALSEAQMSQIIAQIPDLDPQMRYIHHFDVLLDVESNGRQPTLSRQFLSSIEEPVLRIAATNSESNYSQWDVCINDFEGLYPISPPIEGGETTTTTPGEPSGPTEECDNDDCETTTTPDPTVPPVINPPSNEYGCYYVDPTPFGASTSAIFLDAELNPIGDVRKYIDARCIGVFGPGDCVNCRLDYYKSDSGVEIVYVVVE